MTKTMKAALLGVAASTLLAGTPALAQRNNTPAPSAPIVVVADTEAATRQSAAYQTAMQQIQVTYAPQLAQAQARQTQLQTELAPLEQAVRAARAATPVNATTVQAAERAYSQRAEAAQTELNALTAPVALAQAYVTEQIQLRLAEAFNAARTARRADIVLRPEGVFTAENTANLTPAIVAELNRILPNVQIVPPAGYQPGALARAQLQQQQAQQPGAATPQQPAPTQQPQTR